MLPALSSMFVICPICTVTTEPAATSVPEAMDWLMTLTPLPAAPVAFMMSPAFTRARLASSAEKPSTLGTVHIWSDFSAPM